MPTGACYSRRRVAPPAENPRSREHLDGAATAPGLGGKGANVARPFRAHARRPSRLRALVIHPDAGWQRHLAIDNVGLGGARLLVEERIASGDAVTMSLTAPTLWDPLVLRARVAWVDPATPPRRAGVAFEHADARAVFALYELIAALGYE
jgi:hypothetical protein